MSHTVEITTLSSGRVHACPMRDRSVIVPFQTYMNCIWFNIWNSKNNTRHGHGAITLRTNTKQPRAQSRYFHCNIRIYAYFLKIIHGYSKKNEFEYWVWVLSINSKLRLKTHWKWDLYSTLKLIFFEFPCMLKIYLKFIKKFAKKRPFYV